MRNCQQYAGHFLDESMLYANIVSKLIAKVRNDY